jgi:hypothetical protein
MVDVPADDEYVDTEEEGGEEETKEVGSGDEEKRLEGLTDQEREALKVYNEYGGGQSMAAIIDYAHDGIKARRDAARTQQTPGKEEKPVAEPDDSFQGKDDDEMVSVADARKLAEQVATRVATQVTQEAAKKSEVASLHQTLSRHYKLDAEQAAIAQNFVNGALADQQNIESGVTVQDAYKVFFDKCVAPSRKAGGDKAKTAIRRSANVIAGTPPGSGVSEYEAAVADFSNNVEMEDEPASPSWDKEGDIFDAGRLNRYKRELRVT